MPEPHEHERNMRLALKQAILGDRIPGAGHVGCVIVKGGQVAASGFNEAALRYDPTAHAEVVTMRKLGAALGTADLSGYTVYCTLQPCGMCTVACIWAGISRIVYGAGRDEVDPAYFAVRCLDTDNYIRDAFRKDIQLIGGVLKEECAALYQHPPEPEDQAESAGPAVQGVAETALYVEDLDRSAAFYRGLFAFAPVYSEPDRMRALAIPGGQILLLFRTGASVEGVDGSGGRIPGHDGRGNLHLAFLIQHNEVEPWKRRLEAFSVPLESTVRCGAGGTSLYFRDPDGHLVELITPGCWGTA